MTNEEIVVFQDKSWVRLTEYQKLQEEIESLAKRIAELEYQLTHRNCIDCSNHSSKLRMRTLELEKENELLAKRLQELQSDLSRAKSQIEKMKNCQNCRWFLLRLEDEIYKPYCCENDKYLQIEKVCKKWS